MVGEVLADGVDLVGADIGRLAFAEDFPEIGIVEEEADESAFWLEIIIESELIKKKQVDALLKESDELSAIMAASRKTAKRSRKR